MRDVTKIKDNIYNYKGFRIRRFLGSYRKGVKGVLRIPSIPRTMSDEVVNVYKYTLDINVDNLDELQTLKLHSCTGTLSNIKYIIDEYLSSESNYNSDIIEMCKIQ